MTPEESGVEPSVAHQFTCQILTPDFLWGVLMMHLPNLLWRAKRKFSVRIRGIYYRALIRLCGGRCGSNLEVHEGVIFKYAPHQGIRLGDGVHIGPRSFLDVPLGAVLEMGDEAYLGIGVVVAAGKSISIGAYTMIGEYSSIRDSNHGIAPNIPIRHQPNISKSVSIGADVWIGRGSSILMGSVIGDGSIVAANAVVVNEVPSQTIVGGVPARIIKKRSVKD